MKKVAVVVLASALLMISTALAPLLATVSCSLPYTETIGKLGGADFLIRLPYPITNWNGELVIFCTGYSTSVIDITKVLPSAHTISSNLIPLGYAIAFSNFGEAGFCRQKAVIRTHQLTEWVVDNYGVTGKIYLIGVSMGGNVALELGAKYPALYDGVIDLCAPKDMAFEYTDKTFLAGLSLPNLQIELSNRGVPFSPLPSLAAYKFICGKMATDIAAECGGTPDTKLKEYERISPIYSALGIVVPTITLHGTKDSLVPFAESVAYKNAVTSAGQSDLYRLYIVSDAIHGGSTLFAQLFQPPYSAFHQLVDWVENGNSADASST